VNRGALKIIGFGLAVLLATGVYAGLRERAEQKRTMRSLLDSIATMKQQHDTREAALQARFDQINVDRYLQAGKLASSGDIVDGRAELARYRALLVERDKLVDQEQAEFKAMLNALPEGKFREQVLLGAAKAEDGNRKLRAALARAQVANADAVQAVFDWADRNHAIVHARGTSLVVTGQAPLNEFNALEGRVHETGEAVNESIRRVGAVQSKSVKDLARLRRNADE